MTIQGDLQEIFASYQGEGLDVGRRHVFVRTAGCALRCRFCDTPEALVRTATVQVRRGAAVEEVANPVAAERVAAWIDELDPARTSWVSFTGGEPLEQAAFLAALAPHLWGRPVYLETAGVNAAEMALLRPHVHTVAFDLKLPSVAHEGDRREEHRRFLPETRGCVRMAKVIFHARADLGELESLAALVADEDPTLPMILQPETPRDGGAPSIPLEFLEQVYATVRRHLEEVRVIPQTHRFLRLP